MSKNKHHPVQKAAEATGGISALARLIDVSVPTVHQWITGTRRVPAERCLLIEEATGGQVKAEELRPDVAWHVIRNSAAA
jgi:DNA-binding transcriptional regulator YdaS (Cro superfamily)